MGNPNIVIGSAKLLPKLNEIKIRSFPRERGFHNDDIDERTPTTGNSCLPTPISDDFYVLPDPIEVVEMTGPLGLSFSSMPADEPPPSAPRIGAIYDSFTEGSAKGSFDSMPAGEVDQEGHAFVPVTGLELRNAFPYHSDETIRSFIETWREDVSVNTPGPQALTPVPDNLSPAIIHTKRPRSNASDDDAAKEEETRRTRIPVRARASSMTSVSSTVNSFAWEYPVDVPVHGRPPSRPGTVMDVR